MVILEPLSFSYGNGSYLRARAVLAQLDGLNGALSPLEYGDVALSSNSQ